MSEVEFQILLFMCSVVVAMMVVNFLRLIKNLKQRDDSGNLLPVKRK